jgi:cation transport regulator ChaC
MLYDIREWSFMRIPAMRPYFAYGSNLSLSQMKARCPDSRRVEAMRVVLPGYRWFIYKGGHANVEQLLGYCVEGALYELSEKDEKSLDQREGVPNGTYERKFLEILRDGVPLKALVYVAPSTDPGTAGKCYAEIVMEGARDANLSEEYVARVLRPQLA